MKWLQVATKKEKESEKEKRSALNDEGKQENYVTGACHLLLQYASILLDECNETFETSNGAATIIVDGEKEE